MDELVNLRSLRVPRTILKIVYKYRQALHKVLSAEGTSLRNQLPASFPFWLLFLTAMYYRLDPNDLSEFVRGRGNIYELMQNARSVEEGKWGTGPQREFCQYASRISELAGTSMQIPANQTLLALAAVIRQNTLVA